MSTLNFFFHPLEMAASDVGAFYKRKDPSQNFLALSWSSSRASQTGQAKSCFPAITIQPSGHFPSLPLVMCTRSSDIEQSQNSLKEKRPWKSLDDEPAAVVAPFFSHFQPSFPFYCFSFLQKYFLFTLILVWGVHSTIWIYQKWCIAS